MSEPAGATGTGIVSLSRIAPWNTLFFHFFMFSDGQPYKYTIILYKFRPKTLFLGQKINYLSTCQSTNDVAAQLIASGEALEGTVVIADEQTAGRGQRGNCWEAYPGLNLTFSIVLQPSFLRADEQFWLNIAISLGISDWLETFVGHQLRIKWPNDLYVTSKKIGGILIENTLQGYMINWSIVGIGLNINQVKFQHSTATSLRKELSYTTELLLPTLLPGLLELLEQRYLALRADQRNSQKVKYLQRLFRYQEKHDFMADNKLFRGCIVGVDKTGRLIIEINGRLQYFGFKEVEFVL